MSKEDSSKTSRRSFLQAGLLTAASLSTLSLANAKGQERGEEADARHSAADSSSVGQPNILILMVDEQRYPTIYESVHLRNFRHNYLLTQRMLRQNGMEFHRHYTASMACAPSRTSLYTGQYPSLHGVTNTDGAAKSPDEPEMFFLDPNTVPTMGDYFRAAGYRTYYKGKWHISHADIQLPGTHDAMTSYDNNGNRDAQKEAIYLDGKRLEDYGFSGWVGPEPHGNDPLKSASAAGGGKKGRDEATASQAIELLQQLEASSSNQPWLTVVSMVNPHDIALWGFVSNLAANQQGTYNFSVGEQVPLSLFDPALFLQTRQDDLNNKPSCQKSYRDSYRQFFQPTFETPQYYRFYYQAHQNVDIQLGRVYAALQETRFFQNTIVVFTSDHGDLLGSHNGMHQKWYQAYEEALRVPLIFSNPVMFPQPKSQELLTSHVDILPTLLGLAQIDAETIRQSLAESHTEARPLVGKNLAPVILEQVNPSAFETPVYFMTDDDPSRGQNQENFIGIAYDSVVQPSHIECVIARLNDELWKYSRYFDNPQFWSAPGTPGQSGVQDVVIKPIGPQPDAPGEHVVPYQRTVKTAPRPDEFEMYNLTADPMELNNLAGNPEHARNETLLKNMLSEQCKQKRLRPESVSIPGQPACG